MGGLATDVPEICDLFLNGNRYMFSHDQEQMAAFTYAPPFIPRLNTQDQNIDTTQDFWYTWTQRDFSGGEEQKYQSRQGDVQNKYWRGKNVDIHIPGEVTAAFDKIDLTFAANPVSSCGSPANDLVYVATSTNLYSVNNAGTISDKGAHGLGATPAKYGLCTDTQNVYISSSGSSGSVTTIRRWNIATPAFSNFAVAQGADSICYVNNALYGYSASDGGGFYVFSTAGAATAIYQWKDATGDVTGPVTGKLVPFGGKIALLRWKAGGVNGSELYIYDGGAAPVKVAEFSKNFAAYDIDCHGGTVYVSGVMTSFAYPIPTVLFWKDGTIGTLWQGTSTSNLNFSLANYNNGLVFNDPIGLDNAGSTVSRMVRYNEDTAAFSTAFEASTFNGSNPQIASTSTFVVYLPNLGGSTAGTVIDGSSTLSSFQVDSSRIDFDTSVRKLLRGVTIYYTGGGGTGHIDIYYSIDGGAYTLLQASAVSGTEYLYPVGSFVEGTTHQYIQIRVDSVTGSGNGFTLKRIAVRAIPVKRSFQQRIYRVALTGKDGRDHLEYYNGEQSAKDGKEMHADLQVAANKTSPFSITDTMGTYTGVIEKVQVFAVRKDEYVAEITTREV